MCVAFLLHGSQIFVVHDIITKFFKPTHDTPTNRGFHLVSNSHLEKKIYLCKMHVTKHVIMNYTLTFLITTYIKL